ncbi:MAG: hypothetical protein U1F09_15985 [Steroidobacteraceae bacterium]
MSRIGDWLRKLVGRGESAESKPGATVRPLAAPRRTPPAGLEIAETPPPARPAQTGPGGFDPYASDAGYQKPHSWERVDHD